MIDFRFDASRQVGHLFSLVARGRELFGLGEERFNRGL